ncbi:unnamed protein product, partial [Polarella glacialis]
RPPTDDRDRGRPSADDRDKGRAAPAKREREASPPRRRTREPSPDLCQYAPPGVVISKREEFAAQTAARRDAALASRGIGRRLTEAEKDARVEQMRADAKTHESHKDKRIANAEEYDKKIQDAEENMRNNSDQKFFRDIRQQATMDDNATLADRMKTQRSRRQKHLNDPLEKD